MRYKVGMPLVIRGTGVVCTIVEMDEDFQPPKWLLLHDQEADQEFTCTEDEYDFDPYYEEPDLEYDDGMTDMEADADVLRNAGMGTDEDYGLFHDEYEEYYHDSLERDHDEPYEG